MSGYRETVLADSPISYWRLGEVSGSAADEQGVNPGTYNGGYTLGQTGCLTGDSNTALALDGTNGSYLLAKAAKILAGLTNCSVEFWVRSGAQANDAALYCERAPSGNDIWKLYEAPSGYVRLIVRDDAGTIDYDVVATAATVNDNAPHHIVLTKSGTTVQLYRDGVASGASGTLTASANFTDANLSSRVGGDAQDANAYYGGVIDEVAVYNTTLSAARITAHYDAGTTSAGTFVVADTLVATETLTTTTTPVETIAVTDTSTAVGGGTAKLVSDALAVTDTRPGTAADKVGTDSLAITDRATLDTVVIPTDMPTFVVRIDLNRDGDFGDTDENVSAWAINSMTWTRGRSADYSAEAMGSAMFTLRNDSGRFTTLMDDGLLGVGCRVHIAAVYAGTTYAQYFGYVERLTPDPARQTIDVTCYDQLRLLSETDVVVPANPLVSRSPRDLRIAALEDFERGSRNLVGNPSFEADTAGWDDDSYGGGTLARIAGDAATGAGSACGEYTATALNQRLLYPVRMAPLFFAGQVYRLSLYLRTTSGAADWEIGLYTDPTTQVASKTVNVTTTWTRHTLTFTLPATVAASTDTGASVRLTVFLRALAAGSVRLDGVAVTRGQALLPYADTGLGRWPNWSMGGLDGGALNGWYDGWKNLIDNPSFESNLTGWSKAVDAFVTHEALALTRVSTQYAFGSWSAFVDISVGSPDGCHYDFSGTFLAGKAYSCRISLRTATSTATLTVGIGSNGTPTDKSQTTVSVGNTGWTTKTWTWIPSADRSDVHLYVFNVNEDFYVDGAMVTRRDDMASVGPAAFSDTGPGGGAIGTTNEVMSTTARWGTRSQSFDTPATANAGRVYDFSHAAPYFPAGQPFTASVWLRPSSTMAYKVGIGANKGDGTWDEASATGSANAGEWTQVTVTWTPTANYPASGAMGVVLYVYQTDATARTVLVDGVRVIPGSAADEFEMTHWSLGAAEFGSLLTTATVSGSALATLSTINGWTLARHWISPTNASPFYVYRTSGPDTSHSSVESFGDDDAVMSTADLDRASIVNVVPVSFLGGSEYYSDDDSVAKYGPRPAPPIIGPFADRTMGDAVGPALVARYKEPRARPTLTVINRFPSQLLRDLDDLITVTCSRLNIVGRHYFILSYRTTILSAGRIWQTMYQLEEAP